MSPGTDPYSEWDAAYVLGILSPDERREFERHLSECSACTAAVAELAGVPGLLALVPAEVALRLGVPDDARSPAGRAGADGAASMEGRNAGRLDAGGEAGRLAATRFPRLLEAARRRRRRSRAVVTSAFVAVAGIAAALALVLPGWFGSAGDPVEPDRISLEQVVPSPLNADVRLSALEWGTRIDSHCSYAGSGGDANAYALYVTDESGVSSLVATWRAAPGTSTWPSGTTSVPEEDIASVDIRLVETGEVLLRTRLEG